MTGMFEDSVVRSPGSCGGVGRTDSTLPMRLPELVATAYRSATAGLRTQILELLLRPLGPLALVALAAGAFGELLRRGDYRRLVVLPDDVARISGEQLIELVRYVEQHSPETFREIAQLLADNPAGLVGVGGSLLLMGLKALSTPERVR